MIRKALLQGRDDGSRRFDDPAPERRFRQDARPAVEELHDFGARLDLRCEKLDGALDENADQRVETLDIAIGPTLDPSEVSARPAFHHIGRDRPRRTGKPDQGCLRGRATAATRPMVSNTGSRRGTTLPGIEPSRYRCAFSIGSRTGPSPSRKVSFLPESVGHQQNVGEQDSPIHTVAPNRLQRQLGGKRRAQAQLDEIMRF